MKNKRLAKIVTRQIFSNENFRVYEFEKKGRAYAAEIHQRCADGHGRIAYLSGPAYEELMLQTHFWAELPPAESEVEDYLDCAMQFAPNYPIELH